VAERYGATVGVAAIACAAYFGAAGPAAAKDDYCRRGVTGYMLSCGFETLAQCQAMSSGRGGDCIRNPSLGDAASLCLCASDPQASPEVTTGARLWGQRPPA